MTNFFRGLGGRQDPPEALLRPVLPEQQYAWLRKQYIHFCNAKLNSMEEMEDDLKRLLAIPEITNITFARNETGLSMLLGTDHICITDPRSKKTHDIGEFVIVINRGLKTIRFHNVTRTVGNGENLNACFHPHILASRGEICMNEGWQQLIEHVGNGRMYDAARILVKALKTTNGTPYLPVEHWPERK